MQHVHPFLAGIVHRDIGSESERVGGEKNWSRGRAIIHTRLCYAWYVCRAVDRSVCVMWAAASPNLIYFTLRQHRPRQPGCRVRVLAC
eukprot:114286-Chlamydomonas_euryale.AAC.7